MPIVPIDDPGDPRIAVYRQLKATNETRDLGLFVVEGLKLVMQLRRSRYPMASALLSDRYVDRVAGELPPEVPAYVLPHAAIGGIVGYNFHQGGLAAGVRLPQPDLDALIGRSGPRLTLVACPEVQNPENLGAIVRTADVFGVDAVLVGPGCPDPLSRRVLRVSMGTVLDRPVIVADDLDGLLDRLRREHGVALAATVTDPDALPIGRFVRPDRMALLMGSEAHGLDSARAARCDHRLTIPMRPGAESLNVGVAAGIILYELMRSPAPGTPTPGRGPSNNPSSSGRRSTS